MNKLSNTLFYSGTSGIALDLTKDMYPEAFRGKSRLTYYASLFNSIEINSTFYKLPKLSTISKWRESVPANFQFSFKFPKAVTHAKHLNFKENDIELFMDIINNVGNKKGCVLVQFPPAVKQENIKRLEDMFATIKQTNAGSWKIAVEFRNNHWYNERTFELLSKYEFSLVFHDLPASKTPFAGGTPNLIYLRFHGTEPRYRGDYDDSILLDYAQRIKQWLNDGKFVYCYFNNTLGNAYQNLQTLNQFVSSYLK
ncbi:MAG TPA: DUF72 domain-containing protein [Parafilimonas sp.]|nr:DUF72 domain-containing protein [Parafilimonas sp.]